MIVVTGGAGFIGSNLVAELEARGHGDIVVVDALGTGDKWRNLAKRELAAIVRPDEILSFLDRNSAEIDTVFHLGAISATTETDADLIVDTNVTLSQEIWRWCAWRGARMIYASSAATYGDGAEGFDDDIDPAALAKLRPLNPYGWSKLLFDRMVARVVHNEGTTPPQWAGLRFFNVYGPNEGHKGDMKSVIAKLHPILSAGGEARLFKSHRPDYADGGQLRDFVWVGDCVDAMLWLYENPNVSGLFNIGSGKARSFADLARATFRALDREPEIEFFDMPEHLRDKYQYFTEAKIDRLRAAGWDRPTTSLEDGVNTYVREYLSAADPYR